MTNRNRWLVKGGVAAVVIAAAGGSYWLGQRDRDSRAWAERDGAAQPRPHAAQTYRRWLVARDRDSGPSATVDLFVPAAGPRRPRLVLHFAERRAPPADLASSVGPAFERRGVACAAVSFEVARHRTMLEVLDVVTTLVRRAIEHAPELGIDADHTLLVGHELGAWVASTIALDPESTKIAGLSGKVHGLVGLRGTYDLSKGATGGHPDRERFSWAFGDDATRARLSPIRRARRDAPAVLLIAGGDDDAKWAQSARGFARALERAGASEVTSLVAPGRTGRRLAMLSSDDDLAELLVWFSGDRRELPSVDGPWGAKLRWSRRPPLSTEPFWRDEALVEKHAVDDRFVRLLERFFRGAVHELRPWPGRHYHAIDLGAYLDASDPGGRGNFLVVTNVRGERSYLTRDDLRRHRPRLVIGLDDDRNLFRISTRYRLEMQYSFRGPKDRPPTMIRPLGAFLFFPEDPPPRLSNGTDAQFSLAEDSFRFEPDDPLAPIRNLSPVVRDVLAGREGCLTCHELLGAGARAHHVRAADGGPGGGYALGLEDYPEPVIDRFLTRQHEVAESFGVTPVALDESAATALARALRRARALRPLDAAR